MTIRDILKQALVEAHHAGGDLQMQGTGEGADAYAERVAGQLGTDVVARVVQLADEAKDEALAAELRKAFNAAQGGNAKP